jgi:hypothetical protein
LDRALRAGELIERIPPKSLGTPVRYLLITPEIESLIEGQTKFGVFPSVSTDTLVAQYCAGWIMRGSRKIERRKRRHKPEVEQIVGYDEVWALCPREPKPGWRILGRFAEKNVFVALRAWDKHDLVTRHAEAAQQVIDDWSRILRGQQPHRGEVWDDYLSGVKDVDETN